MPLLFRRSDLAEPDEGARIVGRTRRQFIKCAGTLGAVAAAAKLSEATVSPQRPDSKRSEPLRVSEIHCVVTGRNKAGKSVIVSNAAANPVTVALLPGYQFYRLTNLSRYWLK
jgi:hypothetical protein